jgi:Domain of unknown function (DUF222)/HNH endonuclease
LEEVINELEVPDPRRLADDELERAVIGLQRAIDRLTTVRLRLIAEAHRRKSYSRDGFVSASTWLAERNRTTFGSAKRDVVMALALEEMPRTREALQRGDLSPHAAEFLVKARDAAESAFESNEGALVADARRLPLGALRTRLAEWVQGIDPDGADERAAVQHARRRLDVGPVPGGMVRISGELDGETGAPLISALGTIVDRETRSGPDMRSPAQRRADAIAEICSAWLASKQRSTVGAERPHLSVLVDIDVLRRRGEGRCELADVGPISQETARRIACDSSVSRVVTKGASEPLDVGRRTAVVPPGLRRAVTVRDRGCRFPGCDRPPSWCDAHHVVHWADGGRTELANLILLCRPHHRLLHQGFRVSMVEGMPVFRRPDGSRLDGPGTRAVPAFARRGPEGERPTIRFEPVDEPHARPHTPRNMQAQVVAEASENTPAG